jgi:tetratricopeptide (TPR) repeat protein
METENRKNNEDKYEELRSELNMAVETSNYEKGVILCKKLLFFLPNDIKLYMTLSDLYLKQYDLSSSITCLKKVLIINPDNDEVKLKLKNLNFCKGLLNSQENGTIEDDIELLSKMHNQQITKSHYYYLRAKSFLSLGNIEDCVHDIYRILTFDPTNEHAIILLSKVLNNQGKIKEAEMLMWKANEINPSNPETKNFTSIMKKRMDEVMKDANLNVLKGRLKTGLLLVTKALKIYPNHPEALLLRSTILKSLGLLDESIADLNLIKEYLANTTNSDSNMRDYIKEYLSNIYNELSQHKLNEGDYVNAMFYTNEAIKNDPNDLKAHLCKGDIFLKQKDIVNAKDEYLKCYQIKNSFLEARTRLSMVFYKLAILSYNSKDYEEALKLLTSSIQYYNKNDYIHVLRARTYLKLNKIKEAYEDASIAYLLNPNNQDAIEIKRFLS